MSATSQSFIIGRGEDCDVRVDDEYASNHHARVTKDPDGRIWIQDMGSTNGTWLNGMRLPPGARWPLLPGSRVRVGRTEIPWSASTGGER